MLLRDARRKRHGSRISRKLLRLLVAGRSVCVVQPPEPFLFSLPPDLSAEDPWVGVRGGGLTQTVFVRVRFRGGRPELVGLYVDNDEPITSTTLRFRIGEMTHALADYLAYVGKESDLDLGQLATEIVDEGGLYMGMQQPPPTTLERVQWSSWVPAPAFAEGIRRWMEELELDSDTEASVATIRARGAGASPPSSDELAAFATVYREELSAQRRGAKTRTAARVGMDRTTVYKWIARCQQAGLSIDEEKD